MSTIDKAIATIERADQISDVSEGFEGHKTQIDEVSARLRSQVDNLELIGNVQMIALGALLIASAACGWDPQSQEDIKNFLRFREYVLNQDPYAIKIFAVFLSVFGNAGVLALKWMNEIKTENSTSQLDIHINDLQAPAQGLSAEKMWILGSEL